MLVIRQAAKPLCLQHCLIMFCFVVLLVGGLDCLHGTCERNLLVCTFPPLTKCFWWLLKCHFLVAGRPNCPRCFHVGLVSSSSRSIKNHGGASPTRPPSPGSRLHTHAHTFCPLKRSPLLLGAVFHVTSTLLHKNAGCDGGDGGKLRNKVHFCRPAGGPQRELSPPPLDISIIDVL